MNAEQVKKREMEYLESELHYHNDLYHVKDSPIISDSDYDKMFASLKDWEKMFPDLKSETSPTLRVGCKPIDKFKKVKHTHKMLSLDKGFNNEDFLTFDKRVRKSLGKQLNYIGEPKFDGCAIELIYEKGILIKASTRGDGEVGEDVTLNAKTIKSIPLVLNTQWTFDYPEILEVRGEVLISKDNFIIVNKERVESGKEPFANARNAAAGSLRQLDSTRTASRRLEFFAYNVGDPKCFNVFKDNNMKGDVVSEQTSLLGFLKSFGFKINDTLSLILQDHSKVIEYYKMMAEERNKLNYDIDGIVIKVNDFNDQKLLGEGSSYPKWAIALKFEAEQETTRVLGITIQVGRTGTLTPVAELDPVEVGGVTISRVTLHNDEELHKKDVRIGDKVFVQRAGDVIPEIVKVITEVRDGSEIEFVMPTECPSCNSLIIKLEDEVAHKCTNINCKERIKQKLKHFVGKDCYDMDGFGKELIYQLVDKGKINNQYHIFKLKKEDLLEMDRMGERSSQKVLDTINKRRKILLHRFLTGLCVHHLGKTISKFLANTYKDIGIIMSLSKEDLEKHDGIGPEIANQIYTYFHSKDGMDLIDELLYEVEILYDNHQPIDNKLLGKSFLVTGKLKVKTRNEIKELVISKGGKYSSSVSKNLDYLIVGDKPGGKFKKSEDLKITILTEEEFLRMVE